MWTKRHGIWVPQEAEVAPRPQRAEIAPRPHWVTICMGIFPPLVSIAALLVSWASLRLSETTLKVANRPYVTVSIGGVRFSNFGEVEARDKGYSHAVVRMDLTALVQNS